jgi:hypothetical protein
MGAVKRECPKCGVRLTRYQWSRLWWMSSVLSGRLIQPCSECGTLLRLSAMTLVASTAAIGVVIVAISLFLNYSRLLLIIALLLTVVMLVGVMGTRVEKAPERRGG